MTPGVVRRLPWVLWALTLVFIAAGGSLLLAHVLRSHSTPFPPWPGIMLNGLAFGTVGAVVATSRRDNPIGWLFLAIGLGSGVQLVTGEYAMYDRYVLHDGLAGGPVSGWACGIVSVAVAGMLPFVLLLFPDGRFLSPRWRRFGRVAVLLTTASALGVAVDPGELGLTPGIENPFGLSVDNPAVRAVADTPFELGVGAPVVGCLMVGLASLVVRWRRSHAEQRAQLRWVLFAAGAGLGAIVVSAFLIPVVGEWLNSMVWNVALASIPVAIGVSILRYRLYDIDHIVSRTVSYTVITALLVAVYAGLVTAVSRLTPSGNSLAVAASTLTVAALFQPLRRRVQGVVDRRFNRSRYDAARTVEAFSLRLREQVDLDALAADLLGVVRGTVEPVTVSLWLRGPGRAVP